MSIVKRLVEKELEALYYTQLNLEKQKFEEYLYKKQEEEDEQFYREIIKGGNNPSNVRAIDLYQQWD